MNLLERAVEKKDWETAALCLLVGLFEAAAKLPPDTLLGIFDVLEGVPEGSGNGQKG